MEVNQDPVIPEEDVPVDMVDQVEEEDLEMIEGEEKDTEIKTEKAVAIATADAADGNTVKLKGLNFVNYSKVK